MSTPETEVLPCPYCEEEGESDKDATDLVCPFCGESFTKAEAQSLASVTMSADFIGPDDEEE